MPDNAAIEAKFWKALKSDRTIMLGLAGDDGEAQPMTAQIEGDAGGPLWVFTRKDSDLVRQLSGASPAVAYFASKGHDVFAALTGTLTADNDRAAIERLWNPFVAAWYEGGKDDPQLQLIRFEPQDAQIWLNENSLFAGIKLLLGRDPKKTYDDKVAEIRLS